MGLEEEVVAVFIDLAWRKAEFIDRRSTIIVWWIVCDDISSTSGACVYQTKGPVVTWLVNVGTYFYGWMDYVC